MTAADTGTEAEAEDGARKRSKLPLILGLVLALALGGGGFYAAYSGLLPFDPAGEGGSETTGTADPGAPPAAADPPAFLPIEPMVVSLGSGGSSRHLRFRAELEVAPGYRGEVAALMPRILDVLNGYLRAVPVHDLERPTALVELRAQMLRRIQLVAGEGRVRDLLVTEFVLN